MKLAYLYTGHPSRAHPIHREASRYPPAGWSYTPSSDYFFSTKKSPPRYTSSLAVSSFLRRWSSTIVAVAQWLHIPNARWIRVPEGVTLVHSAQYPLLNHTPWIIDFENVASMGWFSRSVVDSTSFQKFFEYLFSQPSCKALLPWTTAARKSLENALECSPFQRKIRVVHHTILPQVWIERPQSSSLRLLFCSGLFYHKGGYDAVLATLAAAKEVPIHLTVVSQYPEEIQRRFGDCPAITLHRSVTPIGRAKILRNTDVLIHPGHSETYGYVMIEAFSYGIPVISTDGYATPELVEDGVRGCVVKNYLSWFDERFLPRVRSESEREFFFQQLLQPPPDYIDRLAQAIIRLATHSEERMLMSRRAYQSVATGIFSPEERKRVLHEIYEYKN